MGIKIADPGHRNLEDENFDDVYKAGLFYFSQASNNQRIVLRKAAT